MKPSSSSYMTKMARARARMCCRTYRGRWPSGSSQSTCHLPKVLLYETSGPGNVPRALASSAAALASHEPANLTWHLFLAEPRSCLSMMLSIHICCWYCNCESELLIHTFSKSVRCLPSAKSSAWGCNMRQVDVSPAVLV